MDLHAVDSPTLITVCSTTNILFDANKKDELQRLQECLCPLLS